MKKQICILGSTGSIGTQALDVIAQHPDLYEVYCLTANNRVAELAQQARRFKPAAVVIANEERYAELSTMLADLPDIKVYAGKDALSQIVEAEPIDMVLTAMVGFAGLTPTIHAIKAGKKICLANKETLVVAGELICQLAQKYHAAILPVDSEHSAIFQSLVGEGDNAIDKILLTCSGGPFRHYSHEQLRSVTAADALRHPTWTMGAKITIDSASLMNKGFEVIEAKWLFGVEADRIQVLIHPQSIVHSAVQFVDGSVKAQLGVPDMRLPIQYAFSYPTGSPSAESGLTCLARASNLPSPTPISSSAWPWHLPPYARAATCPALSTPRTRWSTRRFALDAAGSSIWPTSSSARWAQWPSTPAPTTMYIYRPTRKHGEWLPNYLTDNISNHIHNGNIFNQATSVYISHLLTRIPARGRPHVLR